jgi:hypothetical protein
MRGVWVGPTRIITRCDGKFRRHAKQRFRLQTEVAEMRSVGGRQEDTKWIIRQSRRFEFEDVIAQVELRKWA